MSTQALTADAQVPAAVTYVSSALTTPVKAILDTAFAADATLRVEATSTGPIEVCDQNLARIGYVLGGTAALVTRRSGTNAWEIFTQPSDPIALQVVPASPGAAYVQAEMVAIRTAVVAMQAEMTKRGWFKAE
jgi:hypothetical protein